jgi:hypothetical protein
VATPSSAVIVLSTAKNGRTTRFDRLGSSPIKASDVGLGLFRVSLQRVVQQRSARVAASQLDRSGDRI